jgi:hypothetical protein
MKFLKKESSQISKLGKSSECSATADMTPVSTGAKSMVQLPTTMQLGREATQSGGSGSRSTCPKVQIT